MEHLENRSWKQSFRLHVLVLERYLLEVRREKLGGEQLVYLAGVIARRMDRAYQQQIRKLLLESPDELDHIIRSHAPYIGQNAPIVTISRTNAEYLLVELAFTGPTAVTAVLMRLPARYFDVAAFYARAAGNRSLADLFSFMRKNDQAMLDLLTGYREFLETEPGLPARAALSEEMWEKFGTETNERNAKKERWERMGLDAKRKEHIHREEFNKMLDFTSPN